MRTRLIENLETPYNNVDIWEHDDGFDFEVAGGTHATWHRERILTGYAWDALTAASVLYPGDSPRNLLMLGLGGGTVCRQLRHIFPDLSITAIEIDKGMVDLARRYMSLDDLTIDVRIGDAYQMIDDVEERFDVVIDDVYLGTGRDVLRPKDMAEGVLRRLASLTAPRGIVAANFIVSDGHTDIYSRAEKAFEETFATVRNVRAPLGFNKTLVGGTYLAGEERLRDFDMFFTEPSDFSEWHGICVS